MPAFMTDLPPSYGEFEPARPRLARRVADSFKRAPNPELEYAFHGRKRHVDIEAAAHNMAGTALQRRLKGRHLQMIAIGGSIGKHSSFPVSSFFLFGKRSGVGLIPDPRHWSFRQFRIGLVNWRPCSASDFLRAGGRDVVLHYAVSWRDGRHFSRGWFLCALLNALPGSRLGFCHGLELYDPVAYCHAIGDCCCLFDRRILEL